MQRSASPVGPRRLPARAATRAGALLAGAILAALLAAGCELRRAPGPKTVLLPGFKTYLVEHPVALGERSVRSGTTELRIERAVTEERRTVVDTDSWQMVVHAVVVNHGDRPLLVTDLSETIQLHARSGAVRTGHVYTEGGAGSGWISRQGTSEPSHVPAGGAGRVRIASPGPESTREDPAALTFRGTRLEFR